MEFGRLDENIKRPKIKNPRVVFSTIKQIATRRFTKKGKKEEKRGGKDEEFIVRNPKTLFGPKQFF